MTGASEPAAAAERAAAAEAQADAEAALRSRAGGPGWERAEADRERAHLARLATWLSDPVDRNFSDAVRTCSEAQYNQPTQRAAAPFCCVSTILLSELQKRSRLTCLHDRRTPKAACNVQEFSVFKSGGPFCADTWVGTHCAGAALATFNAQIYQQRQLKGKSSA